MDGGGFGLLVVGVVLVVYGLSGPSEEVAGAVVFGALLVSGAMTALLIGDDGTSRFWAFLLGVFVPGWSLPFVLWEAVKKQRGRE